MLANMQRRSGGINTLTHTHTHTYLERLHQNCKPLMATALPEEGGFRWACISPLRSNEHKCTYTLLVWFQFQ